MTLTTLTLDEHERCPPRLGVLAIALGLAGCGGDGGPGGPPPSPQFGTVQVSVNTSGVDLDVDAFQIRVGRLPPFPSELNGTVTIGNVPAGAQIVELPDLAGNCAVSGGLPVSVTVSGGATTRVEISIVCSEIAPLLDKIVYSDCPLVIWAIDVDGSNPADLTENLRPDDVIESAPAVSADGKRVAFSRAFSPERAQLVVMNADGGDDWVVHETGAIQGITWSPDGTRLAFHALPGPPDIWVANWDGSGTATRVIEGPGLEVFPQWSPDGTKMAFVSTRSGGVWGDIYTANEDGTGITQLTFTGLELFGPYWSPGGTRISFSSLRHATGEALAEANDQGEVYAIDADGGGNVTRITNDSAHDWGGAWSPDGTRIAIASRRNAPSGDPQRSEIYTVDPDGGNVVQVTNGACRASNPVWSPASR